MNIISQVPYVRILRFVPSFHAPAPCLEGGNANILVTVQPAGAVANLVASVTNLITGAQAVGGVSPAAGVPVGGAGPFLVFTFTLTGGAAPVGLGFPPGTPCTFRVVYTNPTACLAEIDFCA
jgi:hypothetical protein